MSVSDWFSDNELISQLRMFFDESERGSIDFQACLGQLVEIDDSTWELKLKGRVFHVDKVFCDVEEVV